MAPPDMEWLLWAKRLKDEHQSLLQRVAGFEKAAMQLALEKNLLAQEHEGALEHIQELTRASSALKESKLTSEKDIGVLKKGLQRTQDEMKLVKADCQKLFDEHDAMRKSVSNLEVAVEQITSDKSVEVLKTQQGILEGQIDHATQDVHRWKKQADAANERLESKILEQKSEIETLTAKLNNRPVSRSFSQATTASDTVDINDTGAKTEDPLQEEIKMIAQGHLTLEEYFAYGKDLMDRARTKEEDKVVRAFVAGLKEKVRRIPLEEVLHEKGWTWEQTKAEMERVIAQMQKNKRTKRYIVPPEEMEAYMKMTL